MLRNPAILFIIFTLFIDGVGVGLIFPIMPDLISELTGRSTADAAIWGGILATGYAFMQFFFGPIIGNLSDRYGRRPVLISALVVMAVDYLIMATAGTIWLLLVGRLIAGITAATHSAATAFMADISAPEEREKNFGLVHAAMGIGFAFGPAIGGLLAEFGTRAPFFVAAGLAGANAIFGILVMPESLSVEKRRPFSLRRANPFSAFKAISQLRGLKPLLIVFGLYQVAFYVYPAIWAYFGKEKFGFDSLTIGLTLLVFGLSMGAAQALLVGPLSSKFGAYRVVTVAIFADVIAFCIFGVTDMVVMIWILTTVTGVSSIATPALQAIMSRAAPDDQQGELQGVLGAIAALATIISPMLMTETFAIFSRDTAPVYLPGAPFLVSAILTLIAFGMLILWRRGAGATLK